MVPQCRLQSSMVQLKGRPTRCSCWTLHPYLLVSRHKEISWRYIPSPNISQPQNKLLTHPLAAHCWPQHHRTCDKEKDFLYHLRQPGSSEHQRLRRWENQRARQQLPGHLHPRWSFTRYSFFFKTHEFVTRYSDYCCLSLKRLERCLR